MKKYVSLFLLLFLAFALSTNAQKKGGGDDTPRPADCGDSPYGSVFVYKFFFTGQSSTLIRTNENSTFELTVQKGFFPEKMLDGTPFPSPVDSNGNASGVNTASPHRAQYPSFEEPMRPVEIPNEGWSAVVTDLNNREIARIPLTFSEAKSVLSDNRVAGDVPSVILKFNTSQLGDGTYKMTLENSATFRNVPITCKKSTPSVVVGLTTGDTWENTPPTARLDVNHVAECAKEIIVTATAYDKDNEPHGGRPRQNLSISWTVTAPSGEVIVVYPTAIPPNNYRTEAKYQERIQIDNPVVGNYKVEITVSDGIASARSSETIPVSCIRTYKAAGVIYFSFDRPDKRLPAGTASVDPYASVNRSSCSAYPKSEYSTFYTENKLPIPTTVQTNAEKLDAILAELSSGRAQYITIRGFTDFKGCEGYNCLLANRRIQAVIKYIVDRYPDMKSKIDFVIVNRGESDAQSNSPDDCDQERIWDRRVELYYASDKAPEGAVQPDCSEYKPCALPAKKPRKKRTGKRR